MTHRCYSYHVYVTTDKYTCFLIAAAQTGEATKLVITHCLKCSSYMGIPKIIKTDNGSRYISKTFQQFCSQWNIKHKTGISYNPQGQGTVEHAYGSLKSQFQKLKIGELYSQSPHNASNHVFFFLNSKFLEYGCPWAICCRQILALWHQGDLW